MIIEIRAAEGGDDAKLLVRDQLSIYSKYAARMGVNLEVLDRSDGMITFRATGQGADFAFRNEAGGHRFQRVPPTERRGRMQTSTITVAVLKEATNQEVNLDFRDIEMNAVRGSGPGGQARNKTSNCIQIKHKPTGMVFRVESERSQSQNKEAALALLRAKLLEQKQSALTDDLASTRRGQIGSGMRGDKRRTIRMQDDQVVDHVTGSRMQASRYMKGFVEDLW